jgi:hypothetical protein
MTRRKISPEMKAMKVEIRDAYIEQEKDRQFALFILGQQRVDDAQKLYAAGFSNYEIGDILGVSWEQARKIHTKLLGYLPKFDKYFADGGV